MATATATPEMFTNVISTFIADSDMGLGTIIGSLMWNILGVAAVSSLANRNVSEMRVVIVRRRDMISIVCVCLANSNGLGADYERLYSVCCQRSSFGGSCLGRKDFLVGGINPAALRSPLLRNDVPVC